VLLQEIIHDLKSGSEAKSVDATPTIEFDFRAKFAETKAAAKVATPYRCYIQGGLKNCNFQCSLSLQSLKINWNGSINLQFSLHSLELL